MVDGAVESSICPCRLGTPTLGTGDASPESLETIPSDTTAAVVLSFGNLTDAFLLRDPKDEEDA